MLDLERLFDTDHLAEARKARAAAHARVWAAKARHDTRGLHEAQRRLREATSAVVQLELRR